MTSMSEKSGTILHVTKSAIVTTTDQRYIPFVEVDLFDALSDGTETNLTQNPIKIDSTKEASFIKHSSR